MSNVQIYSRYMKLSLSSSDLRYLKHFQPLKIIALLEVSPVLYQIP